ncbi:MAG: protein kinase, partial [Planctomycetota bacterium]
MSEPEAAACFAPEHLARFLDERLDEAEGLRITAHLGTCESCRTTLERVAGDPDHWAGAREHIETVTAFDAEPIPEKSDPDGLEEIRRLCDPTDDPASVGRIGAYEVRGFVGRGTAGIVLKAFEPSLDRFVAIKLLSPVFRGHGATRQRFEREARAIAAVRDPHVVPVHGVDEHHGLPFLVMGYVPGESLEERIKRTGPLGTEAAARVGLQVARALAAAHAQGVVHRDVKPANVLLEGTVERAFVTDFGLASVADEAAITLSGMISGTPHYMSPEQARGEVVDARSDLFSLGSLLYAACAGEPPFKAENVYGVLRRVTETEPLPLAETDARVDPWMAALVDRLLKKDPADRFQTAAEVADVLAAELAFAQNPLGVAPPARDWMPPAEAPGGGGRRRRAAAALACAAAGLGALAVAVLREDPETDRSGSGAALLGGVGVPSAGGLPEGVALVPEDEEEAPDVGGIRQIGRANRGILVRAGQIADKTLGAVQRLNLADLDRAPSAFELAEADLEEFFDGQAVGEIVRAATREAARFDPVALKGIDDLLPATLTNAFRVPPPPPVPTPDAQRTFGFAAIGPLDGAPEICIDAEVSPELVNAFCAPEDEECAAELESGGLFTVCTDDEGAFLERGTGQNPVRFLGAAARTLDGLVGDTVDASERGTLRSVRLEAPVGNVDGLSLYLP